MRIAIVSGGIDSVTLAHFLDGDLVVLAFDYGQRHRRELECARRCADRIGAAYIQVDLRSVGALLSGSALAGDIAVPEGHYADESMKLTVVPNRNAIMLTVAFGVAWAQDADAVAIGVHAGDHTIYPDCRPEFIDAFRVMQKKATAEYAQVDLLAPFVRWTKADIVAKGAELGVPYVDTWSCYKGGIRHCGVCGACVERKEAFVLAGIQDPMAYDV